MTEDQPALRQLMRLRGFSVMTNILEDYASDAEVSILVSTPRSHDAYSLTQRFTRHSSACRPGRSFNETK